MKALIVYDSKYGNTKKAAELIGEGLESAENNVITIENVKEIDINKDMTYDLIVIGSPNHAGRHTKNVKKFIEALPNSSLKGEAFAVFDTYMRKDIGKAVKKMEKQVNELMPNLNKVSPGLSIKVGGMKGPIVDEDIPKCKEFGIKLAK
jgi:flavodoxin